MIKAQAMAMRITCARMTALRLTAVHDSAERACRLEARFQWDGEAAAHAKMFSLLADAVDDAAGSAAQRRRRVSTAADAGGRPGGGWHDHQLATAADVPARRGCRRRSAGVGKHLGRLLYTWRLVLPSSRAAVSEAVAWQR